MKTISKSSDSGFFIDRYPCLLPDNLNKDNIIEPFVDYQSTDIQSCLRDRIDDTWWEIGQLNNCHFKDLSVVMLGILSIPHSSAHCERVFSCVKKIQTEQRATIGDNILEHLLVTKSATKKYFHL